MAIDLFTRYGIDPNSDDEIPEYVAPKSESKDLFTQYGINPNEEPLGNEFLDNFSKALETLRQSKNDPKRSALNLLGGFGQFGNNLVNAPSNIARTLGESGIINQGTAEKVPRMQEYNYPELLGVEGTESGDIGAQWLGEKLPEYIAGGGLAKSVGKTIVKKAIIPAAKVAKKAGEYVINKPKEVLKSREAAKEAAKVQERIDELAERGAESRRGKDLLEQVKSGQERSLEQKKESLAEKLVKKSTPIEESLARTEKHVAELTSPEMLESKGALSKDIQSAQKELHKESSKNYEIFNEKGEAGIRPIAEENILHVKLPKEIKEFKSYNKYNEVTKNAALTKEIESINSKIEQKKLELKRESDLEGYSKVKREIENLEKKLEENTAEHAKTHAPTISDYRKIYQDTGTDIADINYQLKYNKSLSTSERDLLRAQKAAVESLKANVLDKLKSSLTEDEYKKLVLANKFHQNMILPFRSSGLLRKATEGEGTVVNNDFFKKASTLEDRELVRHLLAHPKIKESATAHDIRNLNIHKREAIEKFLKERGKYLTENTKDQLVERIKSLQAAEDIDALRKTIKQNEIDLKSNAPHVAKILEKNPDLKKPVGDVAAQKRQIEQVKKHLEKFDMTESERNYELSKYKAHIDKLKEEAAPYKDLKRTAIKYTGLGIAGKLGFDALFGED